MPASLPVREAGPVRRPAVAGYFYPAGPAELADELVRCLPCGRNPQPAVGAIVPHSAYARSGRALGATLGCIAIPRRCIILAPSHTGGPLVWSLMRRGAYKTPLGEVPIDTACAEALALRCEFLAEDPKAQRGEHAVEAVLPMLQWLGPEDLTVVPIVAQAHEREPYAALAAALAQVIRMQEEPVLLMASSNLSHSLAEEEAARHDRALLQRIGAIDAEGFLAYAGQEGLAVCGAQVIACVLKALSALGARQASVVDYRTSAAAGGDPASVTGYGGVVVR